MKKNYYNVMFIICLFTCSLKVTAYDYLVSYDNDYYNPLAMSFKWNVKFNTIPLKGQQLKIHYIINNTQNGKIIFSRAKTVITRTKELDVYLFISNLAAGTGHSIIRMEYAPTIKGRVFIYKFPEKSTNTSILFTGANKIEGDMSNKATLLKTQLLESSVIKINKAIFQRTFLAHDLSLKKSCNFNITFAIQFEIIGIDKETQEKSSIVVNNIKRDLKSIPTAKNNVDRGRK